MFTPCGRKRPPSPASSKESFMTESPKLRGTDTSESTADQQQRRRSLSKEDVEAGLGHMAMREDAPFENFHATTSSNHRCWHLDRTAGFAILITLIGAGVSSAFLALGLSGAQRDQDLQFHRQASEVVLGVKTSWESYVGAALWIHEACRSTADQSTTIGISTKICSREDFKELYEYLLAEEDLTLAAIGFAPWLERDDRAAAQQEATDYYSQNYPGIPYFGFTGFETMPGSNETVIWLRSEQQQYLPIQYLEPVERNKEFLGFDLWSTVDIIRDNDLKLLYDWQPVVTDREDFSKSIPGSDFDPGYYVMLTHPGIRLRGHNEQTQPLSASVILLRTAAIAEKAISSQKDSNLEVYLFDVEKVADTEFEPEFLAWASSHRPSASSPYGPDTATEPVLDDLQSNDDCFLETISIAQISWTVAVCHVEGYDPDLLFIILGSAVMLLATLLLSFWFYSSQRKATAIAEFRATAEAEKASLIIENAEKTAAQEREMTELMSHEVRNPLAAAMSASSFVAAAVLQENPLSSKASIDACREDVHVIQSSLKFINDLLRSLLDMQKATRNALTLKIRQTDIRSDVLEPVSTILASKHNPFDFRIECPEHFVVMTDHLRLKQVVMNLAANSRKFVTEGYIRIGAGTNTDGTVYLFVEDSGPGIPQEKRANLFNRYQESLDSLNQGTGIGLSLSKNLVELMGGELHLDETFDSGVPNFPGTRFLIELKRETEHVDDPEKSPNDEESAGKVTNSSNLPQSGDEGNSVDSRLPQDLNILIVDDDMILRRLILRSLKRVAPSWTIQQAANGETALKMASEKAYDIIFLDQYMASAEKQLLGTETAHAMRAQGVTALICGLSANQIEDSFLKCGANAFIQKPFPCEKEALTNELVRVLETAPELKPKNIGTIG